MYEIELPGAMMEPTSGITVHDPYWIVALSITISAELEFAIAMVNRGAASPKASCGAGAGSADTLAAVVPHAAMPNSETAISPPRHKR